MQNGKVNVNVYCKLCNANIFASVNNAPSYWSLLKM